MYISTIINNNNGQKNTKNTDKCLELGITTKDVDLIIINGERKEWSWSLENDTFGINGLTTHISEFK